MIATPENLHDDPGRYHRQILFSPLGATGDARLRSAGILIVGCGALGSNVAVQLARAGVGKIRLLDRDVVDVTNLHRQVGYSEEDARERRPKSFALARHLARANSEIEIEPIVEDFNYHTARDLSLGIDLLIDGSDNLPARFLLNDLALDLGIPWIYGGAVGEEARAQTFVPGHGPCLRCTFPELPPVGTLPTCDTDGVLGPAAAAAASLEAAMALRCLAHPMARRELAGSLARLTLWTPTATVSRVEPDPECPACRHGHRDFLEGKHAEEVTVLCGRGAVQILPADRLRDSFDLTALARRLEGSGKVEKKVFLLRFSPPGVEHNLTIFKDSRAIVEGTTDPVLARTLYDRYVGQ